MRISLLLDTYGELLTEKQRTFLQRYFEEDLSFGEVAREYGVSRQAIFDSVRHGEETLERFESVLHLVENGAAGGLDRDLEILGARVESVRDRLAAGEAALPSPAILTDLEAIAAALRAPGPPASGRSRGRYPNSTTAMTRMTDCKRIKYGTGSGLKSGMRTKYRMRCSNV
ncbi:MAG: YlxM family DNA-binding protein [bacterium]|nr:YlxM family DNA-binding protein [bacterium]